jgi:hypothetical protein
MNVKAETDPFFESALYYIFRQQKCRTRAEAVRRAIVIAAKAKGWEGPAGHFTWHGDFRWTDREERLRRLEA